MSRAAASQALQNYLQGLRLVDEKSLGELAAGLKEERFLSLCLHALREGVMRPALDTEQLLQCRSCKKQCRADGIHGS